MRVARRDTYGVESIGGVQVRRRIFAGRPIPDYLDVDSGDYDDQAVELTEQKAEQKAEQKVEQKAEKAERAETPTRRRGKAPTADDAEDE
jgi:hypothetical protein